MANDTPSRPAQNKEFMRRRDVPVNHDAARLNDQRKVRPHAAGTPQMGIRPTGGAQKEPKAPPDKLKNGYIQARDVAMKTMTEAELAEWNPFSSMGRSRMPTYYPGDAIGYQNSQNGIELMHVRDGEIVNSKHVDTRQVLDQKLQDLNAQYAELKSQRRSMSINPQKVAKMAAAEFAKENGITTDRFGQIGKDIPVIKTGQSSPAPIDRIDPANRGNRGPMPGTPASRGADLVKNNPGLSGKSPDPENAGPGDFKIDSPVNGIKTKMGNKPDWGTAPQQKPSSRPPRPMGPTAGPAMGQPFVGNQPPLALANEKGAVHPDKTPEPQQGPRNVSGGVTPAEKIKFLKLVDPEKYNDRTIQNMVGAGSYQIDRAYNKLRGSMRGGGGVHEGYPDTNIEKGDEPFGQGRIGDLSWDEHLRKHPKDPPTPDLNREFIQARDLSVERVNEKAEQDIDAMLERTLTRMGFGNMMEEEDCDDGNPFAKSNSNDRDDESDEDDDKSDNDGQWNFQKKKKQTESRIPRMRARWV